MTTQSPYLLDPIDNFCAISGHSSLVINDKLVITTGYAPVTENGTNRVASSPWIRVIDLSKSFNLNKTASVTTILPPSIVPVNIPNNQGASFWWDPQSESVIYTQGSGTVEGSGGVIRDENLISFGRPGKSWTGKFNFGNDSFESWKEIDTPLLGQTGQVASLRRFYDPRARKGFIYGGDVVGEGGGGRNQVLTYDAVERSWENKTTPFGHFDNVGVAVPYTAVSGKVLGIVFGGALNGTPLSMETMFIHDTETDNWYRQQTNGSPPSQRGHFCATVIQGPDGTSTQILVYGGFGDGHPSDVFALSLPSFTWIRLVERSPDFLPGPGVRLQPSCDIVDERFLTIFGGRSLVGGDTANCDKQQNALFMYDLNAGEWIIDYEPPTWNRGYRIPEPVYNVIGGNSSGYATLTEPPEGFAQPTMAELFALTAPATTSSSLPTGTETNIPPGETNAPAEGKKVNVAGIAGGVVAGAIIVIGALVWLFFRKKNKLKNLPYLPFAAPPPSPPRAEIGEGVRYPVEADAFPLRPEIIELNGRSILKAHSGPPVELPGTGLPEDPKKP
ncbi:hypothetical protein TWF718_007782 [Orbilia javanica]|uniref:Kelch repeat-containing protein n=1 Tax=Orbilia javanica TaxID=47235 RepID=A0AAN8MW20_9PEZI